MDFLVKYWPFCPKDWPFFWSKYPSYTAQRLTLLSKYPSYLLKDRPVSQRLAFLFRSIFAKSVLTPNTNYFSVRVERLIDYLEYFVKYHFYFLLLRKDFKNEHEFFNLNWDAKNLFDLSYLKFGIFLKRNHI